MITAYNVAVSARTARKRRRCNTCRDTIRPGHRYLRAVLFPGNINTSKRPWVFGKCVACAYRDGEEYYTGACGSYCCSLEPCALPASHQPGAGHGTDHRCQRCPEERPRRTNTPDRTNPNGSITVTVKRCCDGCGHVLGDITDDEVEDAIAGRRPASVRSECTRCTAVAILAA